MALDAREPRVSHPWMSASIGPVSRLTAVCRLTDCMIGAFTHPSMDVYYTF